MAFPQRPRFLGLAVILNLFSMLWHSKPSGVMLSILALVASLLSIIQEYQRFKRQ